MNLCRCSVIGVVTEHPRAGKCRSNHTLLPAGTRALIMSRASKRHSASKPMTEGMPFLRNIALKESSILINTARAKRDATYREHARLRAFHHEKFGTPAFQYSSARSRTAMRSLPKRARPLCGLRAGATRSIAGVSTGRGRCVVGPHWRSFVGKQAPKPRAAVA